MFMFALNENVVYPGYGVARVNRVIERVVGQHTTHFYELKFLHRDMAILVPVDNLAAVGVRMLSSPDYVEAVFKMLAVPAHKDLSADGTVSSWNKRNKKYQTLLRSGDLIEISKIYRDLQYLAQTKELSFGERALLMQTEALLSEEIAMVAHGAPEQMVLRLRAVFGHTYTSASKHTMSAL